MITGSDGQLFSLRLDSKTAIHEGVGSSFYSVTAVSTKNAVAMTQVSTYHLAIYGADPSEEGALHSYFKVFQICHCTEDKILLQLSFSKFYLSCSYLYFQSGAMLVILNTQFMLVQAHQHYKMFSNNTNLWIIGPNLLLVVGHSLAVVPFLLDTERLCALVGTHKPLQSSEHKVSYLSVIV